MALRFDALCVSFSIGYHLFSASRPGILSMFASVCLTIIHPPDKGPWSREYGICILIGLLRVSSLIVFQFFQLFLGVLFSAQNQSNFPCPLCTMVLSTSR